jgi:hypothetical protein
LSGFAADNAVLSVRPAFPAVTCTAQATYLTGKTPSQHGLSQGLVLSRRCEIKCLAAIESVSASAEDIGN